MGCSHSQPARAETRHCNRCSLPSKATRHACRQQESCSTCWPSCCRRHYLQKPPWHQRNVSSSVRRAQTPRGCRRRPCTTHTLVLWALAGRSSHALKCRSPSLGPGPRQRAEQQRRTQPRFASSPLLPLSASCVQRTSVWSVCLPPDLSCWPHVATNHTAWSAQWSFVDQTAFMPRPQGRYAHCAGRKCVQLSPEYLIDLKAQISA